MYGEEDLYYKEDKVSKEELKQIDEEIKINRIKLIDYLEGEENVQQALNRLNCTNTKIKLHKQVRKQKIEEQNTDVKNDKKFKELLEIVSKLTELSFFDVYYDNYDKILKKYGKFEIIKWNYRTKEQLEDDKLEINEYGPFSSSDIKEWIKQVIIILILGFT